MLLLVHPSAPVVVTPPVSLDNPSVEVTIPWSRRPYLAVDRTGWLPLTDALVQNGIDARRVYEIADANGITDPRRVRVGMVLTIP